MKLPDYYAAQSLKIQQEFERTGDGLVVLRQRSEAVDAVVTSLYSRLFSPQLDEPQNFCLLALGGYGRQELFPHSDIDLLFLTESSGEQASRRDAVAAILRELWDLRLRIGHSVHTLAECGRLYRDNLEFNVALLDCRYLAGDRRLYVRLHDDVLPHLVARDHQDLLRNLADMTRQRHSEYGDTIFHLEPDIKEAPGGLRDYHGPGYQFADETQGSPHKFDRAGKLAMANSGPHTNGSQFFLTLAPTSWLDGRHTIFGEVVKGKGIVTKIAGAPRDPQDRPKKDIALNAVKIERVSKVG